MVYIIIYCVMKAVVGEFKELRAAVVALAIAILPSLRTAWGLWQLCTFQELVQISVKTSTSENLQSEISVKSNKSLSPENDDGSS